MAELQIFGQEAKKGVYFMVTNLRLKDECAAWVNSYEKADAQEQGLIVDLANAIAHGLKLIGAPDCVLKVEEHNYPKKLTTMRFRMGRATLEGACVLGVTMPKTLFKTTSTQEYQAENRDDHDEDYDGRLKVSVIMEGVWNEAAGCHDQNEMAEVVLKLVCGYYYEKIRQHYPEWTTFYEDTPMLVTQPIDHL